jgi:hypothetical protein
LVKVRYCDQFALLSLVHFSYDVVRVMTVFEFEFEFEFGMEIFLATVLVALQVLLGEYGKSEFFFES